MTVDQGFNKGIKIGLAIFGVLIKKNLKLNHIDL